MFCDVNFTKYLNSRLPAYVFKFIYPVMITKILLLGKGFTPRTLG